MDRDLVFFSLLGNEVGCAAKPPDIGGEVRRPLRQAASGCLKRFLSGTYSVAELLCQRLQKPPSDGAVSFDQRTEFPESKSVADEVGCGGDGCRTGAAVDQGDLAEMLARAEGSEVDALARDVCLAGSDDEE